MLGRMFGSDPASPAVAVSETEALLERVGLSGRADLFGSQLTYIDQKRVELARALATRPELLLLDEWLAGLNPTELKIGIELIRQIQREGVTVVMVEHVMEAIRALCGHVVVMNAGVKIAEGTAAEVLADPKVAQVYLGETMLRLEQISVAYGKHEALHDVTLDVAVEPHDGDPWRQWRRQDDALKTIAGLVRPRPAEESCSRTGRSRHEAPHRIVAAGIALVPEGRRLFGECR